MFLILSSNILLFGVVVRDIAINEEDLGCDPRVGQIGHSVANGSPPLRRFFGVRRCAAQTLIRVNGPRHPLYSSCQEIFKF